jgi:hypothetical protein
MSGLFFVLTRLLPFRAMKGLKMSVSFIAVPLVLLAVGMGLATWKTARAADCSSFQQGKPFRTPAATTVYVITGSCTKRPIFNPDVYFSHFASWNDVIFKESWQLDPIPMDPLNFMPWGPRRTFGSGSLIKTVDDPKVYLVEGSNAYPFESETSFKALGFEFNQIEDVMPEVLAKYAKQSSIKGVQDVPVPFVFKYPNDSAVYVLQRNASGTIVKSHLTTMDAVNAWVRADRIGVLPTSAVYSDGQVTTPPVTPPTTPTTSFRITPAKGIYALDSAGGTYRDNYVRDYDFVTGYAWRMAWGDFETSKGVYNFAGIDHILSKLNPINKKLSLLLFSTNSEPDYLADEASLATWSYTNKQGETRTRPVPWDPNAQDRFKTFLKALGDHSTKTASGATVAFRDNPALDQVNVLFPGLGGIREGSAAEVPSEIANLPGYSREKLIGAIIADLKIATEQFPKQAISVEFFPVTDNTSSPSLWEAISEAIQAEFDGVKHQRISFYMENLAASASGGTITGRPVAQIAGPLLSAPKGYATFQMLQSWVSPFANGSATAGTIPTDAIEYAYNTFGSRYVEVYTSDLDKTEWNDEFRTWSAKLTQ